MDEEIERLVIAVRADTRGFAQDVAAMREALDGPLATGADRAGRTIEAALTRALTAGRFGFDDLRRVALSVLGDIASAAIRSGIGGLFGGGAGGAARGGGGLAGVLVGLVGGVAGRATGGPVAPGAAYRVGERGPELFVPTSSGRIETPDDAAAWARLTGGAAAAPAGKAMIPPLPSPPREVRVAITVNARPGEAPAALAQSGRQIAEAVRRALAED